MHGGSGSVLAVTAQNPGADGTWGTADDILAPINQDPANVSIDFTPGLDCADPNDRVRNFIGGHPHAAIFAQADASVLPVADTIDPQLFRVMGTINDRNQLDLLGQP